MNRYFLQGTCAAAAALLAISAAMAGERGTDVQQAAHSGLLTGALQHLRQEQRVTLPRQARLQLAEQRSQINSALAQGGINGAHVNVQAAP